MVAVGVRMRMPAGVIVRMAILVDMLPRHFVMHMNHARHMILVGQTMSDGMCAGQRIRNRRGQHTKQIDQGDEPPCSHSLHSRQADEHVDVSTLYFPNPGWRA